MFGTKMRSVICAPTQAGIEAVVDQQFDIGRQILAHGLVPIIEPEVDIHSATKAEAEELLRASIERASTSWRRPAGDAQAVDPDRRRLLPAVDRARQRVRVVALSGGYPRDEANARLARNHGMIASFSRALTEGLSAQMSDADFDKALDKTIDQIFAASST